MRILLVTMSMDIGGAETHILELAKELKRRKNDVFVMSNGGKYIEELELNGIEHIWAPLHNKNIFNMISSYKILEHVIKAKKIDVVHSHTRISSFICGKLKKNIDFPFVTSAHWTFKVTPLLKFMTDWGENVIAVSDDIKEYLIENYNYPKENIFVTVNGIDVEKFSKSIDYADIAKEFKFRENTKRIVYISRLDESRALVAKQLVNIAEELDKEIENLEIVIVGGGDSFEEISTKVNEINEKLGKKLIILTGPRTDINKFAASGTIFIGVSRAALEAMACEQPVIVAGNEGYLGIFDESKLEKGIETNFCCRGLEMSTEEILKKDVIKLINEKNKEKYGTYNREIVKKYYSVEIMTNECVKAYEKTLKEHKK
ncbi:MAG: glycosyltransferase [Clostridia bacterium]|nr:glycosyltransferase [Clostridia bacterium]